MKNLIPMATAFALLTFTACNNGTEETTTADSTTSTTEMNTPSSSEGAGMTATTFDESASYVDLKSGKSVKVKRDMATGYITNTEDNTPMSFYYNPATNDTFNRDGMVVNNYLIRSGAGDYTLDETRWKVKVDEDGDFKAKDGDGSKVKIDGNEPEMKIKTEEGKMKSDENSSKVKTDDMKMKTKDGKTKVKDN